MWLQAIMGLSGVAYGANRASQGKPLVPVVTAPKPANPATLPKMTSGNPILASNVRPVVPSGPIHASDVFLAAQEYSAYYPELQNVDAVTTAAMAMRESGGDTPNLNPNATRYEPGFHEKYVPEKSRDYATSYGILQLMLQSADELWLAGYKAFPRPTAANLKINANNLYYAMANQAETYKRAVKNGRSPNRQFIVMSYNGGYGANNDMTQKHWAKVAQNVNKVIDMVA